jgi:hypothetical protein
VGESRDPLQLPPSRDVSTPVTPASVCSDSSSISSDSPLIPSYWRPEVEYCIKEKMLTTSARCEIVRTLVSQLFARFGKKPTRAQCEDCSRRLIMKYPLFKDDMGNGYVS